MDFSVVDALEKYGPVAFLAALAFAGAFSLWWNSLTDLVKDLCKARPGLSRAVPPVFLGLLAFATGIALAVVLRAKNDELHSAAAMIDGKWHLVEQTCRYPATYRVDVKTNTIVFQQPDEFIFTLDIDYIRPDRVQAHYRGLSDMKVFLRQGEDLLVKTFPDTVQRYQKC